MTFSFYAHSHALAIEEEKIERDQEKEILKKKMKKRKEEEEGNQKKKKDVLVFHRSCPCNVILTC